MNFLAKIVKKAFTRLIFFEVEMTVEESDSPTIEQTAEFEKDLVLKSERESREIREKGCQVHVRKNSLRNIQYYLNDGIDFPFTKFDDSSLDKFDVDRDRCSSPVSRLL